MTEHWKQFTLYPPGCRNQFHPRQVLHTFLPAWLHENEIARWHCLFEPSALVRYQAADLDAPMTSAEELALEYGLSFERGDASADLNPKLAFPGEDYFGEAEFYGEALWEANQKFMQACSLLAIELVKLPHDKTAPMIRKFIHLYGNALGMNYLEEASAAQYWAERCMELYKEYGRS